MGNDGLIIENNGQWWIEKGIMAWTNEKERILGSEKLKKNENNVTMMKKDMKKMSGGKQRKERK